MQRQQFQNRHSKGESEQAHMKKKQEMKEEHINLNWRKLILIKVSKLNNE